MEGPQLDNYSTFTSGGTNSFTVGTLPNQCLVVFCIGSSGSNPNSAPSVTYNGTTVTWAAANENTTDFVNSPWIGYITNPSQGAHNLVSPGGQGVVAQVWHNVHQTNPFIFQTKFSSESTSYNAPRLISLTTAAAKSVLLKSFWGQASDPFMIYSDGIGETGGGLTVQNGAPFADPYSGSHYRWSYKHTTTAQNYDMSTSYVDNFGSTGSTRYANQVVELQYSGPQAPAVSSSVANSASRLATVARSATYYRGISDSVSNSAGRIATAGKYVLALVSTTTANAAGRLATATATLKAGWYAIAKNFGTWTDQ